MEARYNYIFFEGLHLSRKLKPLKNLSWKRKLLIFKLLVCANVKACELELGRSRQSAEHFLND